MKLKIKIFTIFSLMLMIVGNEVFGGTPPETTKVATETAGLLSRGAGALWRFTGINQELLRSLGKVGWTGGVLAGTAATAYAGRQAYRYALVERIKRTAGRTLIGSVITEDLKKSIGAESELKKIDDLMKSVKESSQGRDKVFLIVSNSRNKNLYSMSKLNTELNHGTQYYITPNIVYPTREENVLMYKPEGILKIFIEYMTKAGYLTQGEVNTPQTILISNIEAIFNYNNENLKKFFEELICKAPDTKRFIFSTENIDLVNVLGGTCAKILEIATSQTSTSKESSEITRLKEQLFKNNDTIKEQTTKIKELEQQQEEQRGRPRSTSRGNSPTSYQEPTSYTTNVPPKQITTGYNGYPETSSTTYTNPLPYNPHNR